MKVEQTMCWGCTLNKFHLSGYAIKDRLNTTNPFQIKINYNDCLPSYIHFTQNLNVFLPSPIILATNELTIVSNKNKVYAAVIYFAKYIVKY